MPGLTRAPRDRGNVPLQGRHCRAVRIVGRPAQNNPPPPLLHVVGRRGPGAESLKTPVIAGKPAGIAAVIREAALLGKAAIREVRAPESRHAEGSRAEAAQLSRSATRLHDRAEDRQARRSPPLFHGKP